MIKIIYGTPILVWPMLLLLLWGGWKATKTTVVSWRPLYIFPIILLAWSLFSMLSRYGAVYLIFWATSLSIGAGIGWLTLRKIPLRFDKQRKLIEIGGSWKPMLLSLSIFSLRYSLGAIYGMYPELSGSLNLLILENLATLISGMLLGRLIAYWQRSKIAPHTDLITA